MSPKHSVFCLTPATSGSVLSKWHVLIALRNMKCMESMLLVGMFSCLLDSGRCTGDLKDAVSMETNKLHIEAFSPTGALCVLWHNLTISRHFSIISLIYNLLFVRTCVRVCLYVCACVYVYAQKCTVIMWNTFPNHLSTKRKKIWDFKMN